MHFNSSRKVNFKKIFILSLLSLSLSSIIGVGFYSTSNLGQNLTSKVFLNNGSSKTTTSPLNLYSYLNDVSFITDNSIKVSLNVNLPWSEGYASISFDKSRIDKFRNDASVHRKVDNCEYFNIALNSDAPTSSSVGKFNQYVNLISNDKYIWESGFNPTFDLIQELIKFAVSNPILDLSKNLYINFVQKGNGKFEKNLTLKKDSFSHSYWYVSKETVTLPETNGLIFEGISNVQNIPTSSIECIETSQSSSERIQTFKINNGIPFSLVINPTEVKVNSSDIGQCTLYSYLEWVRNLAQNYADKTISFGNRVSIKDAIVINQNEYLNYLASNFTNVNQPDVYKRSIANQLSRNGFISKPWEISSVYNLKDSSLNYQIQETVNQVVMKNNLVQSNDETGIFYKVIKLDNAFYLGKDARINPNVPWLYYLCDDSNEPFTSYYIAKFEVIKKAYPISSLNYDFNSRQFYFNTNGVDFMNLSKQKLNWPSKIYLTHNPQQWVSRFKNALNSGSSISLSLAFKNSQNIPLSFSAMNQNITSNLYDGFVDFFAANGIQLKDYGITGQSNITASLNNDSINFTLNYMTANIGNNLSNGNNNGSNMKTSSIDTTTASMIGILVGVILIITIVGIVLGLGKRNKSLNKNVIVNNRPINPKVVKPQKPIKPPRKPGLIVLNKQNISIPSVSNSMGVNSIPPSVLHPKKTKLKPKIILNLKKKNKIKNDAQASNPVKSNSSFEKTSSPLKKNKIKLSSKIASKFKDKKNKFNSKHKNKKIKNSLKFKKNKNNSDLKV